MVLLRPLTAVMERLDVSRTTAGDIRKDAMALLRGAGAAARDVCFLGSWDRVGGQHPQRGLRVGGALGEEAELGHGVQIPELPRRCESSRWVSTMPIASMSAYKAG
ncbi:hypothetical protein ABZ622_40680 [Streptomyces sp. NPDC007164]|uniref:hypothetical protein n=1 Tax=Streptomyces sp. NPDC007164 TaxID=3156918 RepID=UPI0033CCFC08